jgi:hypothetical protein
VRRAGTRSPQVLGSCAFSHRHWALLFLVHSDTTGKDILTSSGLGVVLDSKSLAVEGIVGSTAQLLLHLVLGSISAAGNSLAENGGNARGCETALEEHCVEY